MLTEDGSKVSINGWKRSGIFDAVTDGSSSLPSIDPFQDMAPLPSTSDGDNENVYPIEVTEDFVNLRLATDDDDSDWGNEEDDEFDRNAFDFIVDDE